MPHGLEGGTPAEFIDYLKTEARLLHKAALNDDPVAIIRIRRQSPSFTMGADLQRKHCLAAIARELGFDNWKSARDCFSGLRNAAYGTFLHPARCHVHWNIWFADISDARRVRAEHGGYLLEYKNQYMVVDQDYIVSLGLDPHDTMWDTIDRDWTVSPGQNARFYFIAIIAEAHLAWHNEQAGNSIAA